MEALAWTSSANDSSLCWTGFYKASETRTTSRGNATTFPIPEEENVVLAYLAERTPSGGSLNSRLSVHGRELCKGILNYTKPQSYWNPLFFISKEAIRTPSPAESWIPTELQELKGRQLKVSSSHPVKWQVLSLPLSNYDMIVIPPDQELPLNLPEHHVWVALWNKNKDAIKIRFYLSQGNPRTTKFYNSTLSEGWLIMSISTEIIFYGIGWHKRWVTQLQERDVRILTNYQLHLQVFPMPLEPQETSKLPGITTGMYTGTTTIKPEVPSIATSTGTPPVRPEGPPVSVLTIIGVVVPLLVVIAASYFCYRCYFKKQNETRAEGIAMEEHPGTVSHSGCALPDLRHVTENPLYGKIAPRDVTGIARPLHRDRWPRFHRLPLEKESCNP
ncbi:uncharacterized protein [Macrobrachium rosenbergii]|uniref:uncharacterized protein isoform X2 n=1 Tax=Macrobrachium rosenbergii TaxID=79674 RepID=UPI0034D79EE9